jgi:multidrug efflux system membrane fusion protein
MLVRRSYLWALLAMLAIAAWLGSGIVMRSGGDDGASRAAIDAGDDAEATESEPALTTVRVATLTAGARRSELVLRGRSEAVRRVEVRSQTDGQVIETPQREGALVEAGAVLCQLDIAEREAMLAEAKAAVHQADLDFSASAALMKKGYAARTQELAHAAKLDSTRAMLKRAQIVLGRTTIQAPFRGIVEDQIAEAGSYLTPGSPCARLVEMDPMLVVAQVSERDIAKLRISMEGIAHPVTGGTVKGTIRFIGTSADAATRTFRVELEVPNPDLSLRDGVTAELKFQLEPVMVHNFSSALLALNEAGVIGVRAIDQDNVVRFMPVGIEADDAAGAWVTGLPESVTVITVGQEYVSAGEVVRPIFQTAEIAK